jgi:hypothetical protein
MLSRYTLVGGRRLAGRRSGETAEIYVDRFPAGMCLLLVGIFLLNVLDAVFTLLHLQQGGEELNPIVARIIDFGPQQFFFIKSAITFGCLLFLLFHIRFRYVQRIFGTVFAIYLLVLCYHLYLNAL